MVEAGSQTINPTLQLVGRICSFRGRLKCAPFVSRSTRLRDPALRTPDMVAMKMQEIPSQQVKEGLQ